MGDIRERKSGVPGLVILGKIGYLSLHHEATRLSICSQVDGYPYGRAVNNFRLVRDARAAAQRVKDILAWDNPRLDDELRALPPMEAVNLGRRITEALRSPAPPCATCEGTGRLVNPHSQRVRCYDCAGEGRSREPAW